MFSCPKEMDFYDCWLMPASVVLFKSQVKKKTFEFELLQAFYRSPGVHTTRICCCLAAKTTAFFVGIPTPAFRAAKFFMKCRSPLSGLSTFNGVPEIHQSSPVAPSTVTWGTISRDRFANCLCFTLANICIFDRDVVFLILPFDRFFLDIYV